MDDELRVKRSAKKVYQISACWQNKILNTLFNIHIVKAGHQLNVGVPKLKAFTITEIPREGLSSSLSETNVRFSIR